MEAGRGDTALLRLAKRHGVDGELSIGANTTSVDVTPLLRLPPSRSAPFLLSLLESPPQILPQPSSDSLPRILDYSLLSLSSHPTPQDLYTLLLLLCAVLSRYPPDSTPPRDSVLSTLLPLLSDCSSESYHLSSKAVRLLGSTPKSLSRVDTLAYDTLCRSLASKSQNERSLCDTLGAISAVCLCGSQGKTRVEVSGATISQVVDLVFATEGVQASPRDLEDSEGSDVPERGSGWRVRQQALHCLASFASVQPQRVYQQWSRLFPQSSQQPSVLSILWRDRSAKVRGAAADLVSAVVTAAKPFMVAVGGPAPPATARRGAFSPFAVTLGATLRAMHSALVACVAHEQSSLALVRVLRCLTALVNAAPYDRLGEGLLAEALQQVARLVPGPMELPALCCLSSILAVQPPSPAVAQVLQAEQDGQKPLHSVVAATTNPSLVSEALRALSCAARCYFSALPWAALLSRAEVLLRERDSTLRQAILRVFDCALSSGASQDERNVLWKFLLAPQASPMITRVALEDPIPAVRAAALEVLSSRTVGDFASLPSGLSRSDTWRRFVVPSLRDRNTAVRSAAWKVVGDYCTGVYSAPHGVPASPDDASSVEELTSMAVASVSRDRVIASRTKAAWALANLTTCFSLCDEARARRVAFAAVKCLSAACGDHEKVRANAVRGLGYLVASPHVSPSSAEDITNVLLSAVASSAQDPKSQWNACKAVGAALSGAQLTTATRERAAATLCGLLVVPNLKTRIQAADALGSLRPEDARSRWAVNVWGFLVSALSAVGAAPAAPESVDPSLFKYKDTLSLEIVFSLSRLGQALIPAGMLRNEALQGFVPTFTQVIRGLPRPALQERSGAADAIRACLEAMSRSGCVLTDEPSTVLP